MPLRIGRFELHEVRDGSFALDGGSMFGVIPKVLWEKQYPPDARNRITLALRSLLIVDGKRKILVDTGAGTGWDAKRSDIYALDRSGTDLLRDLARAGVKPEEITDVVLTHLHFDHAGGAFQYVEGKPPTLTFPNATHHIQRRNWTWSQHASDRDKGSFRHDSVRLLERTGKLHLLEGNHELVPGVELFVSEGHTVGLQLVRVVDGDHGLVYCGDLIPTVSHLKASWGMAFDLYPLTVMEEKRVLLAQAIEERWALYLQHDPHIAACTVKEVDGEVVVDEVVNV